MVGRRVLVIGTFDPRMPRARQWLRLLDGLGCDVEVRNISAWDDDRATRTAGSALAHAAARLGRARYDSRGICSPASGPISSCSCIPGHLDACVLGPIARVRADPDRARRVHLALRHDHPRPQSATSDTRRVALATRAVDTLACWSVKLVVVDTPEHADFFSRFTRRGPQPLRGALGRCRRVAVRAGRPIPVTTPTSSGTSPTSRCTGSRPSPAPLRCSPTTAGASDSSATARNAPPRATRGQGARDRQRRLRRARGRGRARGRDRARVGLPRSVRDDEKGRSASCPTRCSSARRPDDRSSPPRHRRSGPRSATHS